MCFSIALTEILSRTATSGQVSPSNRFKINSISKSHDKCQRDIQPSDILVIKRAIVTRKSGASATSKVIWQTIRDCLDPPHSVTLYGSIKSGNLLGDPPQNSLRMGIGYNQSQFPQPLCTAPLRALPSSTHEILCVRVQEARESC
jgi:hypothetical protein